MPRPGLTARPADPGTRAPDGNVRLRSGDPVGLLEFLAAHGHVLLSCDAGRGDHDTGLNELLLGIRTGADLVDDVHVVVVRRLRLEDGQGPFPHGSNEVLDPTGHVHDFYGAAARPVAVLVRPDGTIAWRGNPHGSSLPSIRAVIEASLPPAPPTTARPHRLSA